MQLHLAVDASGIKDSGGARVLLDFVAAALDNPGIEQLSVFSAPNSHREFAFPESATLRVFEERLPEESYAYRILWWQNRLRERCSHLGVDRLFCLSGAGISKAPTRHTTLIQQSLPFSEEYARIMSWPERIRYGVLRELMRHSCRSAAHVIVQTPTMKDWITRRLGLQASLVTVIVPSAHLGVQSQVPPGQRQTHDPDSPLLLYVGSAARHKNLANLFEGMRLLWSRRPKTRLLATLSPQEATLKHPHLVCLGRLSIEELSNTYAMADLLVMPSIVETVGLPMVEAMSLGVPVLAADRPYAHDVCLDAAHYFDPLSPAAFADTADHLLSSPLALEHMRDLGKSIAAERQQTRPYSQMVNTVIG